MAKVRIIINKSKPDRTGACPLKIRITNSGSRNEIYLPGIKVLPKNWDSSRQQVINDKMLNIRIQNVVSSLLLEIGKLEAKEEVINPVEIIQGLKKRPKKANMGQLNAIQYCLEHFTEDPSLVYSTRKSYKSFARLLQGYDPTISLDKMDSAWVAKFKDYLFRVKKLNPYSISARLKLVRRICLHAFQNKVIPVNHLQGMKIAHAKAHRNYLTIEQIRLLEAYKPPLHLETTWKAYCFAIYTGLRFGDLSSITYRNIVSEHKGAGIQYRLQYSMKKTNKQMDLALGKKALGYVDTNEKDKDKPIFDLLTKEDLKLHPDLLAKKTESANALANKRLKQVCKAAGLVDSYSFHTARHTFFCTALELGIDLVSLKELGGHSNLQVTQQYLKVLDTKKTEAMLKFDSI